MADNANLELMGAQFLLLKAKDGSHTEQLVYFAKGVGEFYLSRSALVDLGVINKDFPNTGDINEVNGQRRVHVRPTSGSPPYTFTTSSGANPLAFLFIFTNVPLCSPGYVLTGD